ncbi:MAG: hypothetical protein AB2777_22095 [Candidatus Thiodiazotropha endolucinida]
MNYFRSLSKPVVFVWIALLSVAMLFASNLNFHVHDLDIDLTHHSEPGLKGSDVGHDHVVNRHLSIDSSHADHHDTVMVEMRATPDGVAQQPSSLTFAMDLAALLLLVFVLIKYPSFRPRFGRIKDRPPIKRLYLTPLLRAPPC